MTGIDLADEDTKFMKYLVENGWHGEVGEDDDRHLVTKGSTQEGIVKQA
jgi:aminopeptidase C